MLKGCSCITVPRGVPVLCSTQALDFTTLLAHQAGCLKEIMPRNGTSEKALQTTLLDIPEELLSLVFTIVGVRLAVSTLPANSRLHKAWQAAVKSVDIKASTLREADVKVISKLVNLKTLQFQGPSSPGAAPVWRVAALVAPQLSRLTKLDLKDIPGAFDILKAITNANGLHEQLCAFTIRDTNHKLCSEDLWGLVDLKALRTLCLSYHELLGGPQELSTVSSKLTQLQQLLLDSKDASATSAASMAAFPGSLQGLTCMHLQTGGTGAATSNEQQLINAVSALTNLRELRSDTPHSAAAQQQALSQLKLLTRLHLTSSERFAEFTLLSDLPELRMLEARKSSIRDPFTHPALEDLEAGRLLVSQQWRGKTAEACKITCLTLSDWADSNDAVDDASLQNMPMLPRLGTLFAAAAPSAGKFLQLAALLRRQALTLEMIQLVTAQPFEEAPPRELPRCKELILMHHCIGRATLQLLSLCSMPCLSTCCLRLKSSQGLDVEADLGWLRGLPALKVVQLVKEAGAAGTAMHTAVRTMLADTGVRVELC